MDTKSRIGLTDVARHAKVSLGTASRVLNGHPSVSSRARRAVEDAILQLGYRSNPAARSLPKTQAGNREWTGNIALFLPNSSERMLCNPFVAETAALLQQELAGTGCHLVIATTSDPGSIPNILLERKVDGVIIHGAISAELCRKITALAPAVGIFGRYDRSLAATVDVDTVQAIQSGVDELVRLGHTRIGFVGRRGSHHGFASRLNAYREAMRLHHLPVAESCEILAAEKPDGVDAPEEVPPDLDASLARSFGGKRAPTALMVCNDWTAIGVYRGLRKLKLDIPGDVSVIGFDSDMRICEALQPRLTSLRMPLERISSQAVKSLMEQIKRRDENPGGTTLCAARLDRRESCREYSGK